MSQQDEQAEQNAGAFTIPAAVCAAPKAGFTAPEPDQEWPLPGGFAHVFHGERNTGVTRPVVIADGFSLGRSDLGWLHAHLDGGGFPLISQLRARGRDVILVGFDERSDAIQRNAETVTAAVLRTVAERLGGTRLMVGGFSMGGIVARFALAKLEQQRIDHQAAVYFSWDSPHRGAVIPLGLQAFSHFISPFNDFARQMNSPAARQMLWRHYDPKTGAVGVAPERERFLADLADIGGWPRIPRLLGLANGRGDGEGLGLPAGDLALELGRIYPGTTFRIQAQGDDVTVAELKRAFPKAQKTVTTSGLPESDSAPGGTLNSFKILADALKEAGASVDLRHEDVCFVPSVSAVSIRDLDQHKDLYEPVDDIVPDDSELDDYVLSSTNTAHTQVTPELATWLIDRLPD